MTTPDNNLVFEYALRNPCDPDTKSAFIRDRTLLTDEPLRQYFDVGTSQVGPLTFQAMLEATEAYIRKNCPGVQIELWPTQD